MSTVSFEYERGKYSLEILDPGHHTQVFVIAQVHVVSVGVPGVEGMEADHVHPLNRDRPDHVSTATDGRKPLK